MSLSHLMAILPDLHPKHLTLSKGVTIRQLRLVSKEVGLLAQTAVTSCEVFLGMGGPSPTPQQLAKLFQNARLRELRVTIVTVSGV